MTLDPPLDEEGFREPVTRVAAAVGWVGRGALAALLQDRSRLEVALVRLAYWSDCSLARSLREMLCHHLLLQPRVNTL